MREINWTTYGATVIDPIALLCTLLMGLALLRVPRSRAVLPIILVACLVPVSQRVVIATLDFNMVRLLILFGWLRIAMRGEHRGLRLNVLDKAICAWAACAFLFYTVRVATTAALIYRLGTTFDTLGMYFMIRLLLRSRQDVGRASRDLATMAIVMAAFMLVEFATGRNMFSVFGGVSPNTIVRDGKLRCQAAFSHPIMAGSFGAGLLPIAVGLWLGEKRHRLLPAMAVVGATLVVIFSSSSGPAMAWIGAVTGCVLWRARRNLAQVRIAVAIVLLFLHFIREKPVWHLIGRLSDLIGGDGYHRVMLISGFVDNFREWWFAGTPSTAHWGWGLQDVTNQFVLEGVNGGLATFAAFVAVVGLAFALVGRYIKRIEADRRVPRAERLRSQYLAWGLGASLLAHCVAFVSVSYFGQMNVIFYMLFAMIASLYDSLRRAPVRARPPPRRARPPVRRDGRPVPLRA